MQATASENLNATAHFAMSTHARELLIESAGLFWILAELIILFFVLAGRSHLESVPLLPHFQWTRQLTFQAAAFSLFFLGLLAVVYGRAWVWPPAYTAVYAPEAAIESVQAAFTDACRRHLMVWAAFVTIWVMLEILIVYHGWRGYRSLRMRLGVEVPAPPKNLAFPLLLLLACCCAARAGAVEVPGDTELLAALRAAYQEDALYRNAMYLYLRLAGVVWIAVEWIAAIVLWRAWRMLSRAAKAKESRHAA